MTDDELDLWRETNELLRRIAASLELAIADPAAEAEAAQMSASELERFDGLTPEQQEFAAAIELLEERGEVVPAASYRFVGLDPPRRETEPTAEEMEADQPGAETVMYRYREDDEPETARRRE